ncbi:MAG: addiction module toxin RelE [Planctomycetaceae bacterium]|nr:addiction module toxin RelE [Planctomycetaceae bacterium]
MAKQQPYSLVYDPRLFDHLKKVDSKYQPLIEKTMTEQLTFEPHRETRNRKPLRVPAPFDAGWELRFGPDNRFRVLYDIDGANHVVNVLAFGIKDRNRLLIGGEEVSS